MVYSADKDTFMDDQDVIVVHNLDNNKFLILFGHKRWKQFLIHFTHHIKRHFMRTLRRFDKRGTFIKRVIIRLIKRSIIR